MNRKIALPSDENGILDGHFGHCRFFDIYETVDDQIISHVKLVPPPHEPGVLPKWLVKNQVTDVITGGIGEHATRILNHFQINVFKGAPKLETKVLAESLLNQTIELSDNNCDHHHDHSHHHDHHHKHNHAH